MTEQNVPNTEVSGGATIPYIDMPINFHVKTPSRARCPEGYYWVAPYTKGFPPFQYQVQGHCRKAGFNEKLEEQQFRSNLKFKEMKEKQKIDKKNSRLMNKRRNR